MKFASLFSGCGGFDLGFLSHGFQSCGAYDLDTAAIENFKANVRPEAIRANLWHGVPNETSVRALDALIAGPPCQGFSTVGKRDLDDERNKLLLLTGTLARRLTPRVLVVENVSGALAGDHSYYFEQLEIMMRLSGYRTHTMICQVLHLGMAQLRRRVLFFAWRTGRDITFSQPTIPPSTLRSALRGISTLKNHNPRTLKESEKDWLIAQRIRPGQKLSNVRGGSNSVPTWDIPEVFGSVTEHEKTVLELLRRLRRQERRRDLGDADPVSLSRLEAALGRRFNKIVDALVDKGYLRRIDNHIDLVGTFNGKYRRLSWEKPSCTVDTRFGSPRYYLHPSKSRGFTVREAARIQGFPDSYAFSGTELQQYRMIGNAVPPPLGAFAADLVKKLLGVA